MLKVLIRQNEFSESLDIIFVQNREDGKRYIAEPVEIKFKEHKLGDDAKPTISLGFSLSGEFLKAMAEALDKQGIKTENDFKIAGLLEATKYHLEDMRKIALMPYKSVI